MDWSALLSNKYVLYGGAALAALTAYMVLAPASAPADSGSSDVGGYLLPSSAIAPVWAGGGANGASTGGLGMDAASQALVDLESQKNATTEKLGLASIDANYSIAMGQQQTDAYTAGLFADTAKFQAATDFASNAMKLLGNGISAVSGNFKVPGMASPLTFDLTQIFAGTKKGPNNSQLGLVSQFNSSTISNAPLPAGSSFGRAFQGAPNSKSAGFGRRLAEAYAVGVAGGQSSSLATLPANSGPLSPAVLSGTAGGVADSRTLGKSSGVTP